MYVGDMIFVFFDYFDFYSVISSLSIGIKVCVDFVS